LVVPSFPEWPEDSAAPARSLFISGFRHGLEGASRVGDAPEELFD
jgi:hypothetical protein